MSSTLVDARDRDRAFERLYHRYVREVYRYVLALLRNPSEAEDVTQTTFLNAYRAMQAGAEPQKAHNWLIAIAHNACRTRVRFAMRRPKEVPIDELVEQLAIPESERVNVRELLRALGRLPFNQRAALTMRELEGRTYPEIAETLGVSVPAVESLITRARRTMRLQAASLRGLAVVIGLPRSLRRLVESGDVAGGTIGAGAVAKAAAVLVAGVVAGGVGYEAMGPAQHPQAAAARPSLELAVQPVQPASRRVAVVHHRHVSPPARRAHRAPATPGRAPVRRAVLPRIAPDPVESAPVRAAAGPAPAPAPSTAPAASSSPSQPAASPPHAATPLTAAPPIAPEPLPEVPVPQVQLQVQLPPVPAAPPLPQVQLPALPPAPPLPPLPSLP